MKGEQKVILANHCSMTGGPLDNYYDSKREASSSKREATDHATISEKLRVALRKAVIGKSRTLKLE